jgi:tetratricopeptide (TPR) repeat protein
MHRRDELHEANASDPASISSVPAWDPAGIGLLAVFLSILPAGILQAINYGRLGAPERIRWALVRNLGTATVLFSAAAFTELPDLLFAVFNSLSYFYFRESQRDLYLAHRGRGGAKASFRWPIVYSGLGILSVLLLVVGSAYYLDLRDERRFNEAVAHMEAERYEAAEALFKKYQSSNPDDIASYWNLALVYLWQADTQRAVQQLRASIAKDPSDTSVTALLAELAPTSSTEQASDST